MLTIRKVSTIIAIGSLIAALAVSCSFRGAKQNTTLDSDVIVVGAGIAGLSTALEAARGGAKIIVIDMFSVFGGHAVMAQGGVSIVGTPVQRSLGIYDTPELAYKDFMDWGEDANPEWVRHYVNNSRREIYDWLTELRVVFDGTLRLFPGNSVPRFHNIKGRGLGLVSPIYRECVKSPNIKFLWNTKAEDLIAENGRVIGVVAKDLRTRMERYLRASAVVLATGGFQSNLEMVREFWPKALPFPEQFLVGSGLNSTGSGLKIAQKAGAGLFSMDHQWNYITGLPDPRYPDSNRGLMAYNPDSIWVNAQGRRFVREFSSAKEALPVLLNQKPATYWAIFDEGSKPKFWVSGSEWGNFSRIQEVIFDNPNLVKSSPTIRELAIATGLPASVLADTVRHYNEMVDKGEDIDFGRFGPGRDYVPRKIEEPPFYAVRFFPLTRKSMGGIMVDTSCRVLDKNQHPIPGLYAAGEVTGFAGINGRAGLEGTFLGPSILTGRITARAILTELGMKPKGTFSPVSAARAAKTSAGSHDSALCKDCHNLEVLIEQQRNGYWHFEEAHGVVLQRKYECTQCHAELAPDRPEKHSINRLAQVENCAFCHVAQEH
ncbi:MAG TPA: FAD-dependent oxidoreductase [Thermodesulfobacteriota bacterium]|nr:FAD-dependent oxidoreductase [Thermodesulfobacteriota bacterium]